MLAANAVPHGAVGVVGREFPSPFASPPGRGMSPPWVNVLWSAVNIAGSRGVLDSVSPRRPGEGVAFAVGAGVMAVVLTGYFARVLRDR
ncbi:hypothetical protein GCM10022200_01340 [Microbacterium awajiense]|uniref:Uncharacterized protein n=2 Tax=Microbacterium awajiense TaxID=415214 RepID=A0ABP6ZZT7_9MICO